MGVISLCYEFVYNQFLLNDSFYAYVRNGVCPFYSISCIKYKKIINYKPYNMIISNRKILGYFAPTIALRLVRLRTFSNVNWNIHIPAIRRFDLYAIAKMCMKFIRMFLRKYLNENMTRILFQHIVIKYRIWLDLHFQL